MPAQKFTSHYEYDIVECDKNSTDWQFFADLIESKDDDSKLTLKIVKNGIKLSHYVGYIQTPNGRQIEILPKIFDPELNKNKGNEENNQNSIENTRKILFQLIRLFYNSEHKIRKEQLASDNNELPINELIYQAFLNECENLYKRKGMRGQYNQTSDNLAFMRGKLNFSQHIRHNFADKTRLFCNFDEFNFNSPANKIIKYATRMVQNRTQNSNNMYKARQYLELFSDIDDVNEKNIIIHLRQLIRQRPPAKQYKECLIWAELIIDNLMKFGEFYNDKSIIMLWDMNKLYEKYAIYAFKKSGFDVVRKSNKYLLNPNEFQLNTDICLNDKDGKIFAVIDAKYKILSEQQKTMQADLYQLFAYGEAFIEKNTKNIHFLGLIYPVNQYENDKLPLDQNNYQEQLLNAPKKFSDGKSLPLHIFRLGFVLDSFEKPKIYLTE